VLKKFLVNAIPKRVRIHFSVARRTKLNFIGQFGATFITELVFCHKTYLCNIYTKRLFKAESLSHMKKG